MAKIEGLNYEALNQFDQTDIQVLLAILMYDIHPCGINGPFVRWQRILKEFFNSRTPTEFSDFIDEWDATQLNDDDKEWEKHYWPHSQEYRRPPKITPANSDAWKKFTFADFSLLYVFATSDVHPCYRGPRIVFLCHILEEICGGRARNYRNAVKRWTNYDLTDEDKSQERQNLIETAKFWLRIPFANETEQERKERHEEEKKLIAKLEAEEEEYRRNLK